jgi:hypothetical protein
MDILSRWPVSGRLVCPVAVLSGGLVAGSAGVGDLTVTCGMAAGTGRHPEARAARLPAQVRVRAEVSGPVYRAGLSQCLVGRLG